jgi:hypothetical protein
MILCCVVVSAIKLMPEKEVQNLKILKLMVDNLNPIEKLMTENFIYHVYGIHDRCKLTDICPFYLFVFTIYSNLLYVKYSTLWY